MAREKAYRIVVGSEFGDLLSPAFEPASIECRDGQTILTTPLIDDCALYGLLDRLRDFNLELVSLHEIEVLHQS